MAIPDRLPTAIKPTIPEDVENFQEQIYKEEVQRAPSINCNDCSQTLHLQDLRTDWQTGTQNFYLGPMPGYECRGCQKTFLAEDVVTEVINCINQELEKTGQSIPFTIPERISII